MGQLINKCMCDKYRKKYEAKEDNEESVSDDSFSENEGDIIFKTREEIPKTNTDIQFKTDALIRSYNFSPYQIYEELSTLGEGAYGIVKKVCLKNNKETIRAMKIISKQNVVKGQINKLFEEIEILRKLEHPNIMKIYEYFIDENNLYIISEFCDEGDLLGKMKKLNKMSELVVKYLMSQILDALLYLHANRVFHGDIKLENIMLYKTSRKSVKRFTVINKDLNSDDKLQKEIDNNQGNNDYVEDMSIYEIKLIDFGCSKFLNKKKHNKLSGIVGTSMYCSPEVIDNSYDEKSDEWSCGVLMYILLCGYWPFEGETEEEIFENIKKYNINFDTDELKNVSDNCKDLMKRLLNPEKQNRITAFDALKHPFFTQKLNPMKILTKHKDLSILKKFFKLKKYPTILHKVVVAYCCFNFIDKDEERKLSELFRFLDQKKQKKLTLDDFKRGFKEAKISVSLFELKNIMNLLDTDGNNLIEYQEFLRALCDKDDLLNEKNLRAVFDIIDKDKKGYANINDINNFIVGNGQSNFKEKALKKLDEQIGEKKDLKMTFEEFCDFIRNDKSENNKIESYKSLYYESNNVINEEDELVKDDEKNLENKRSHEI